MKKTSFFGSKVSKCVCVFNIKYVASDLAIVSSFTADAGSLETLNYSDPLYRSTEFFETLLKCPFTFSLVELPFIQGYTDILQPLNM
jgi:hypothetical protein